MRIAILEPYIAGIGGAQRVIADYAIYLQKHRHYVVIFTQRYEPETAYPIFKKLNIQIIKPSSKILSPLVFLLRKYNNFDIIVANDWPSNFATIFNKNTVWICYTPKRDFYDLAAYTFENTSLKGKIAFLGKMILFKYLDKLSAKKARKIIVASKNVAERVREYYRRNAIVINYGIFINNYYQGREKKYFLCVSRFVAPKRVDLAIKSMEFVKDKSIFLYIIGDGPEKEKIKNLCSKYSNVKLIGKVSEKELISLYAHCLGLIYVPLNEDWGLCPIEAAASGKPVIGVNEGGLKETIIQGKTGFLIDRVTTQSIAKKINYLIDHPNQRRKMGMLAKKHSKKFDWENLLSKIQKEIIS